MTELEKIVYQLYPRHEGWRYSTDYEIIYKDFGTTQNEHYRLIENQKLFHNIVLKYSFNTYFKSYEYDWKNLSLYHQCGIITIIVISSVQYSLFNT